MEYFVDATITFKGKCDTKVVDKAIKKEFKEQFGSKRASEFYKIETCGEDKLKVELTENFAFSWVESLVQAVVSTGMKKFGRDKLIAYQTCAQCYFKNYVTKDGKFLDFCGDCYY